MSRLATLGLISALAVSAPAFASAAPQRPVAAQLATTPGAPIQAAPADASGYAQREQQDKQVANYEGGSTIVIGISGGALVVLLLILLLI
jgi:hypothetical protein